MATTFDERMAARAKRQGGHISRDQLYSIGMTRHQIDYRVQIGRLIAVHRGVYAVGHVPTLPFDLAKGALLAGGPDTALFGRSAASFWGIHRVWELPLEIVGPTHRRLRKTLVTHRIGGLVGRDLVTVDGVRVTSAARTLLDSAPSLPVKRLTRAVEDLRLAGKVDTGQLEDILARNQLHPGRLRLEAIVATRQKEPTRSDLEDAFQRLVYRYSLPTPQVNVHVAGYRVDAYYADAELIVELDGWAGHQTRQAFARDRRQDADILARTGIRTMRLPYEQTTRHATRTAGELAAILARGRMRRGEEREAPRF
jgi:very-short-patch-repair endonuclease